MRLVVLAALAFLALAPSALAQPAPVQPPDVPSAIPSDIDPGALSFAHAMLTKSDLMPNMAAAMGGAMMPRIKADLLSRPGIQRLSAENQAKVSAHAETLPALVLSFMQSKLPVLEDEVARTFTKRFTSAELADIDAYFNTPEGANLLRTALNAGVQSAARGTLDQDKATATKDIVKQMSDAEMRALLLFSATPGGQAFGNQAKYLGSILTDAIDKVLLADFQAAIQTDMCKKLGSDFCLA